MKRTNSDKKILIIDDEQDILDSLQFVLEAEGYTIQTTKKGEYINRLKRKSDLPALIILDVLLSGKDGREICKELKSSDITHAIPIIMISAHPSAKDSVIAIGADDFIAKPFDIDLLLKVIKKYI